MAKKYKYRAQEIYKDVMIDVKADTLEDFVRKVQKKKDSIDRQTLDPNTKLSAFVKLYLETYKMNSVSDTWFNDLERFAQNKIVPGIGDKPVGKIKPIEVQNFLNSLSGYSASYVKKLFDLTNQIFRYAFKNGMTSTDFTLDLQLPKGRKGKKGRSLTDREREVLLQALNGHRGELFCKIMLYCGLRPGEVSALQWKDIDFKEKVIDVNKAKKKNGTIGYPKTNAGLRKVPIPEHFLQLLYSRRQSPFDLVCSQINGRMHTESSRKKMWKNIKREMNIIMGCKVFRNELIPPFPLADDFVMYYLRHTYCTDLEKKGVPLNIARRLMGHESIEVTAKIYTHNSDESLQIAKLLIDKENLDFLKGSK